MPGGGCRFCETFWTVMFHWLIRLSCRPVIINGLDRTMRMNMENGLDGSIMTNTDSPRLAVTRGEWYASETIRVIRTDLRQMNGFTEMRGAMCDYRTAEVFTQIDSAVADCGAAELDDLIFRRTSFPPDKLSAGSDRNYTEHSTLWGFPHIDSAAVDYGAGAVELDDLIIRRMSFPPDELSAGRNGDYIWRDLWIGLSVCNRSVTGSLAFGSSHILGRCCLWLAALPFRWIRSAEVSLCHHLLPAVSRSASHEVEAPFLSPLCRHPVWPDGGSVLPELSMYELDMSLYAPLCCHLLSFDPAVHRTASHVGEMFSLPPCSD